MAEQKHSDAPWRISKRYGVITTSKPGVLVGSEEICDYNESNPNHEANARLLVESPAMHEALKLFVEYDDDDLADGTAIMLAYAKAIESARAVLARVEGEGE